MRAWVRTIIAYFFVFALSGLVGASALEIILRMNPRLMPIEVPTFPPVRRFTPNQNVTLDVRVSDEDLWTRMPGYIRPLDPGNDRVVAQMHLVTDHLGLRNAEPWQNHYDIIALGDSFTYGHIVSTPWPQGLAQQTNRTVMNLGWVGIGPLDERDLYLESGRDKSPFWVVLAFFEGNDLNDAASYAKADPLLTPRLVRYYARLILGGARPVGVTGTELPPAPPAEYLYPLRVLVGTREYAATLFNFYLAWLGVRTPDLATSQNLRLTSDAFKKIRAEMTRTDARLLIVYLPSKEHLLAPEISDAQVLNKVLQDVNAMKLDAGGYLFVSNDRVSANEWLQHIDDQRRAIGALARESGAEFLDLTPCLKHVLAEGTMPFYEFDTHWDQTGHDLAAEWIGAYITRGQVCS